MRRTDWEARLSRLISTWHSQPFKWGERDCAQLALAVLVAVSARDWAQIHIQPYNSARGAKAMLQRLGVPDMPALADKILGARLPVAYAQRGDLVSSAGVRGTALGVCLGAHAAFTGPGGLTYLPMSKIISVWRV